MNSVLEIALVTHPFQLLIVALVARQAFLALLDVRRHSPPTPRKVAIAGVA